MPADPDDMRDLKAACDELRIINSLINKVCRARETNRIMTVLIAELVEFTDADQGVINLVEVSDSENLETVVRRGRPESNALSFKLSSQISGCALQDQEMIKVDDLDGDDRFAGVTSENGQFKSIICSPMLVRGDAIGLLTLVRSESKGPFRDDQYRIVGIVASQSAQVLSNAILLEELAQKNELLRLSQHRLRDENTRLQSEIGRTFAFENVVAKSAVMKNLLTLTSKACDLDSPVLITGPTGTGKELIARALHYQSDRAQKPFVVKNCGVKTESLLEAELFGHVKGAFTGADRARPGLFKEANGGTIFLDEIGDAPLSTQVAILRVLENGEIRPLGASKTELVDVRVISATNKDLAEEIQHGRFRQDLYYRLNTFTLALPPLRERREDIPLLVSHFLRRLGIKLDGRKLTITPGALDLLARYSWPGNIRQLENEIERAAVVCDTEGVINVEDLSPTLRGLGSGDGASEEYHGRLREIVGRVERQVISDALAENEGNILRTSKALGLTRKGLKDKMSRYGISLPSATEDAETEE